MDEYIGNMHIVGKKFSYSHEEEVDVFLIRGPSTVDHIWPTSRNGSNKRENKQFLTKISNQQKAYELKGYINGVRYAIVPVEEDEHEKVIGCMYVSYDGGSTWYEVV